MVFRKELLPLIINPTFFSMIVARNEWYIMEKCYLQIPWPVTILGNREIHFF